jgi:hypothetical protein
LHQCLFYSIYLAELHICSIHILTLVCYISKTLEKCFDSPRILMLVGSKRHPVTCYLELSVAALRLDVVGSKCHPVTWSEKRLLSVPYTSELGIDAIELFVYAFLFFLSLATSVCSLYTHEGDLNSFFSQILTLNIIPHGLNDL